MINAMNIKKLRKWMKDKENRKIIYSMISDEFKFGKSQTEGPYQQLMRNAFNLSLSYLLDNEIFFYAFACGYSIYITNDTLINHRIGCDLERNKVPEIWDKLSEAKYDSSEVSI